MSLLGIFGVEEYKRRLRGGDAEFATFDVNKIRADCPRLTWKRSECAICPAINRCNFLKGKDGVAEECRHLPDIGRDCAACLNRAKCNYFVDEPEESFDMPEPPPPDLNCPQRCGSCYNAPTCAALKEHIEFAKDFPAQNDFKALCQSGDRSQPNFRNCLACRRIERCEILRRVMQ